MKLLSSTLTPMFLNKTGDNLPVEIIVNVFYSFIFVIITVSSIIY